MDICWAALSVLPRLILAATAVRDPGKPGQVIRGIQGACSCNGVPSLAPSCSSRCSTSCRRSPCSHTRDGRNRADRLVCQAYEPPSRIHPTRGVPLVSITGGGLGCRGLAPQGIPPHLFTEPHSSRSELRRSVDRSTTASICNIGSAEAITAVVGRRQPRTLRSAMRQLHVDP